LSSRFSRDIIKIKNLPPLSKGCHIRALMSTPPNFSYRMSAISRQLSELIVILIHKS